MSAARLIPAAPSNDLRLRRRWYPMGHAVEVVTNSPEVLSAAAAAWDEFPPLSNAAPVELRIQVSEKDACLAPSLPTSCHLEYLISIVEGPENFAIGDMISGVAVMRISRSVAEDSAWLLYHFLEPVAYVLLGARHFTFLHAACVALEGKAALLCGPAGAGKTCLAYACAKRGWSFVSGDATHLLRDGAEPTVIGRPFSIRFRHSAKTIFPELKEYRASIRPNGKRDYELDPRQLNLPIALVARPSAIVFLNRVPTAVHPSVRTISQGDAEKLLSDSIRCGDVRIRNEQWQALSKLFDKSLLLLTYSEPFAAERTLRAVIGKAGLHAV